MSPSKTKSTEIDTNKDKIVNKLIEFSIDSPKRARDEDDTSDPLAQCSKPEDLDLAAARKLHGRDLEVEKVATVGNEQGITDEEIDEFLKEADLPQEPTNLPNIRLNSNLSPINGSPDALATIPSSGPPLIRPAPRNNNVRQPKLNLDGLPTPRAPLPRTRPSPYNNPGTPSSRSSPNSSSASDNLSGNGPSNQPSSLYSLVFHPTDYWSKDGPVVSVNDKNIINRYINDNLKARDGRNQNVVIRVDKFVYRNGVIVFKLSDPVSERWVRVMMEHFKREDLNYQFALSSESNFRFIPAFTGWTPDEDATFERFAYVASASIPLNASTWRFVRLVEENKKRGATGKKFMFLADDLQRSLVNGVIRFKYDANTQRAVIKFSSGPSIADIPNSNRRMDQILHANFNQDVFDDLLQSEANEEAMEF